MSDKVLITAALLYANGKLHFGHLAGAYLPADVHARFQRLMKRDVFFVSGSDEYGVAITMSAEKAGRTPREQVDRFHEINTRLFEELSISFDHYSRTTWKGHVQPVQKFFLDIESYYDKTLNAYLKKDLFLLRDIWYNKDDLITKAELLMDNLDYEDKEKIKDLLRIADHCKDMGALI